MKLRRFFQDVAVALVELLDDGDDVAEDEEGGDEAPDADALSDMEAVVNPEDWLPGIVFGVNSRVLRELDGIRGMETSCSPVSEVNVDMPGIKVFMGTLPAHTEWHRNTVQRSAQEIIVKALVAQGESATAWAPVEESYIVKNLEAALLYKVVMRRANAALEESE